MQQTTGMPTPPVMLIATRSASGMTDAAAARGPSLATGANRHPTRRPYWDRVVVAHAHLKAALRSIDGGHLSSKQGAMAFPTPLHQIHPGVNHFVAQRAFRGLLRQRFQHGPRQHDFTSTPLANPWSPPVITSRSAHAAIAPTHRSQRLSCTHEHTRKVLTVQPMKQGQQWLQRHGGDAKSRHPAAVSQTQPCFEGWSWNWVSFATSALRPY